jgi:hypothetical protein
MNRVPQKTEIFREEKTGTKAGTEKWYFEKRKKEEELRKTITATGILVTI